MIYSVNTENFALVAPENRLIFKQARPATQYLLLCTATWCPHCQRLMQVVHEIDKQLNGRFTFLQAEQTDPKTRSLMTELDVQGYPTMFFIAEDGFVERNQVKVERTVSGIINLLYERAAL